MSEIDIIQFGLIAFLLVWVILASKRLHQQDQLIADLWQSLNELSDRTRKKVNDD